MALFGALGSGFKKRGQFHGPTPKGQCRFMVYT